MEQHEMFRTNASFLKRMLWYRKKFENSFKKKSSNHDKKQPTSPR